MATPADDRSRILGGAVALGAVVAALRVLLGLAAESYWAIALPVAILVLFVLGLVFWIGWTILTVQVEAEGAELGAGTGGTGSATSASQAPAETSETEVGPGAPGP